MSDIIPNTIMTNKSIDFNNDTIQCSLLAINPVPTDPTTYFLAIESFDDLQANELTSASGYAPVTVTSSEYVEVGTDEYVYSVSAPEWTALDGNIGPFNYAVFYDTTQANSIVYVYDLLKFYIINDGGTLKLNIDSDGLFRIKRDV